MSLARFAHRDLRFEKKSAPVAVGVDLLEVLDAIVRADPGAPGFTGHVGFAIEGPAGRRTWVGRFGASVETELTADPGPLDATLVLDPASAEAVLLEGRARKGAQVTVTGDPDLLRAFVRRYTARTNPIAVRAKE